MMKYLKKTFAIVLTVAMIATLLMVPVLADAHEDADKLETLGILVGSGDGITDDYLESPATRITSAILLLKLKGVIADAEAWNGTENFNDADDALSLFARSIMGYLKETPAMGFVGDGQGNFKPNAVISAQEYYKVLLVALGYEQGVDFEWSEVMDFAAALGLDAIADIQALTIKDFAKATVEALDTEVKGTGMTLIKKLVVDGIIDGEDAKDAGWVVTPDLAIESAAQAGKNKIEVKFTTAVDTSATTIAFKQGLVFYYVTVAWNDAKDTATLTTAFDPIPAGTYTVEVSGIGDEVMTKSVAIEAEFAASIEITTAILYDSSNKIVFAVKNQFGEDMGINGDEVFATAYTVSPALRAGNLPVWGSETESSIGFHGYIIVRTLDLDALIRIDTYTQVDDVIQFTLVYMGMSATKTFTVQADPAASNIAFGTVSPLANKSYIFVNDAGLEIPYVLFDQYGIATKLTEYIDTVDANQAIIDGILFITSNAAVVDPDTFAVDSSGKLTFTAGATAGTAVITAIWNANIVGQISITVTAAPTASAAAIAAPTMIVAGGDTPFDLGLTLQDQFGGTVTSTAGLTITAKSGTDAFGTVAFVSATAIKYTPPSGVTTTKVVTIDIMNDTTKIGTLTFNVQPDAYAASAASVTFPTYFQKDGMIYVQRDTVNVLDQYGRAFTGGYVELSEATGVFSIGKGDSIFANEVGTGTVRVRVDDSVALTVNLTCIADTAITEYALTVSPSTIYASADEVYFATPKLTGMTTGGQAVVLKAGLPTSMTSSNPAIAAINGDKVEGKAAGTATIYAWDGATLLASATVTVSTAAPVAQSITFSATALGVGYNLSDILVIKDQYGVNIVDLGGYAIASSDTAVINEAGAALTTGTVEVTVVQDGIISATTEITVSMVDK